ncbi:MAG: hypothetical protein CMJ94_14580 [Planctomycetes bacterium]|nr:hypothetical protein [Planctomycetota bacterium]
MMLSTLLGAALLQTSTPPSEPITLLVNYHSRPDDAELDWYRAQGATIKYRYSIIPTLAVIADESLIESITDRPNLHYIEEDTSYEIFDIDNTWGVEWIGGRYTLASGYNGAGIKVGVIDTGIDYNHPELASVYAGGWDFVNNDADPMDDHFHGTHVSGTIAAQEDGTGVVGVAPAVEIYALKGFSASGNGVASDLIAAVDWTTVNGMDVVNNSWGGGHTSTMRDAFDASMAAGVIHVCASGNNYGFGGVSNPARYASTYAIGAMDINGKLAPFSNRGPEVDFAAPGVDVLSANLGGGYTTASGTSMASPHACGVVALLLAHGNLVDEDGDGHLFEEVRNRMAKVAIDRGDVGRDNRFGWGVVNAPGSMVEPMFLQIGEAQAGQAVGVQATGCTPSDTVTFLHGFRPGRFDLASAGTLIGIRGPQVVRTATADAAGFAGVYLTVPGNLSGLLTYVQAIETSSNTSQVVPILVQ